MAIYWHSIIKGLPTNKLEKSLAIIGTRTPDKKYGNRIAKNLGEMLLNRGWWNISGLATGCDEYMGI